MYIWKVVINNYRCLRESKVELSPKLNILVGDNECGKSTLLEAINLALTGQLNGRLIYNELHPHLINAAASKAYIDSFAAGKPIAPPSILIELWFGEDEALAKFKGNNNSTKTEGYGVQLVIQFDKAFSGEYQTYIADPAQIRTVPIEYYHVVLKGFDDTPCTPRAIPLHPKFIDASTIQSTVGTSRYVVGLVKGTLDKKEQVGLSLSYRKVKDAFHADPTVKKINDGLAAKADPISNKALSVSLDTTARANWDSGIMPLLDDIPLPLVGKGEQNSVNIRIGMDKAISSHIFLIEEPENHLSFTNLARLIGQIDEKRGERQVLVTTHSSFVLNKLGLESIKLFHGGSAVPIADLSKGTQDYFKRVPDYNTLRLVLAKRAILVEGSSDELIVQKAYLMAKGKQPREDGIDVITVGSLAFKRFLEIAVKLKKPVAVVTDNDGKVAALKKKYVDYIGKDGILISFDEDETCRTLEPQMIKANGWKAVAEILDRKFETEGELLEYMVDNKADCALKFFETEKPWKVPEYIAIAIG